jgi:hypothetical protein
MSPRNSDTYAFKGFTAQADQEAWNGNLRNGFIRASQSVWLRLFLLPVGSGTRDWQIAHAPGNFQLVRAILARCGTVGMGY